MEWEGYREAFNASLSSPAKDVWGKRIGNKMTKCVARLYHPSSGTHTYMDRLIATNNENRRRLGKTGEGISGPEEIDPSISQTFANLWGTCQVSPVLDIVLTSA